jgi:hypothetical protein
MSRATLEAPDDVRLIFEYYRLSRERKHAAIYGERRCEEVNPE